MTGRVLGLILLAAAPALAQTTATPPIADNSFLVEEAYNQEYGVVQHISTFSRPFGDGERLYTFTQEWPVPGPRHQLSFTVPLQALGGSTGFGDVALNYRFQALDGSRGGAAFSPRASLLLPTGSPSRGHGAGGAGLQVNLPLSVAIGTRLVSHSNLGATWIANANDISAPASAGRTTSRAACRSFPASPSRSDSGRAAATRACSSTSASSTRFVARNARRGAAAP